MPFRDAGREEDCDDDDDNVGRCSVICKWPLPEPSSKMTDSDVDAVVVGERSVNGGDADGDAKAGGDDDADKWS